MIEIQRGIIESSDIYWAARNQALDALRQGKITKGEAMVIEMQAREQFGVALREQFAGRVEATAQLAADVRRNSLPGDRAAVEGRGA